MFVYATIQINPSLSLFKSTHCTYTDKKEKLSSSMCDNELHGHPDSIGGRLYYATKYNKHSENS